MQNHLIWYAYLLDQEKGFDITFFISHRKKGLSNNNKTQGEAVLLLDKSNRTEIKFLNLKRKD